MKLVIVQADCIEGFSVAWVCKRALKGDCEIVFFEGGAKLPDMTGRDVLIFGVSFARHLVAKIAKEAVAQKTEFRLFDNDFKGRQELSGIREVKINMNQTPARMAWEFLRADFTVKIGPKGEDFRFGTAPWIVDYSDNDKLWKWPHLSRYLLKLSIENCYERTLKGWDELASRDLAGVIEQGKEFAKTQTQPKEKIEEEKLNAEPTSTIEPGTNKAVDQENKRVRRQAVRKNEGR